MGAKIYDRPPGMTRQRAEQLRNPEKLAARNALNNAIRAGQVRRPKNCSVCGILSARIHGHHADYALPLDVQWLCARCHRALHDSLRVAS